MSTKRSFYACCDNVASGSSRPMTVGALPRHYARRAGSAAPSLPAQRFFSATCKRPARVDHYGLLNLHPNATKQQIKARFYELSKKTHPDTAGGSAEKFLKINEAYSILGDESKRREYDLSLSSPSPSYASDSPSYGSAPYNSPYSDPHNRRSGPHSAWSTRRPPPRAPPTGHGHYSPFGRHTPKNYGGAGSGSYGDPWASAREQFREEFAHVRNGNAWMNRGQQRPGRKGKGPGGMNREDVEGGDAGRLWGFVTLCVAILAFGGGITTARADDGKRIGEVDLFEGPV